MEKSWNCVFKFLWEPCLVTTDLHDMAGTVVERDLLPNDFSRFFFQMRDVKAVGVKFWHVLYPKQSSSLLRECKYTVLPAKSDSYVTFCLQSHQGLTI